MIAKVIKTDESVIYNGIIYGFEEEFEIDDAIGNSLIERGYIVNIEDAEEIKEGIEIKDVDSMSYPDLKSYASELGLSAKGTKDELIARINEHFAEAEEVEAEEIPDTSMPE